ncbi:FAD-dependent oxidoreductase [Lichenicola cladoniae]|uniref:FAD-dependent oxidoreductase n=1 Tax=Lichenicola cladoniae TaxID=1484109 RepID=A0A6M8HRD4_9PROT|nr:FAD-dependent oxidoreductase [Lichenicola cladoniae]NPD68744.1 FAD-dependent oxidoreductase [Acetobacteraceae bacterium]QKE90827.1 FAD-dependent oxidoreductase [Lichenicola cladoniae]
MRFSHDVIVIGGGSAGLTTAGGCGRLGLRTALIERARMGGECLNSGCVPSKALLAAAARAQSMRDAGRVGIQPVAPVVVWAEVRAHLARVQAAIAPHDGRERFEAWGVEVIAGEASFTGHRTIRIGERALSAPRIVVATGSRPRIPPIDGLAEVPFLTNETLWDLAVLPDHLVILGAGPVGIEMAQAFRRLGSAVTLVGQVPPLAREDRDAASLLLACLAAEGVTLRFDATVTAARAVTNAVMLTLADGSVVRGSHLLVATGRVADLDALDLLQAGVEVGPDGIVVDAGRRTSNPAVMALGDCRAGPRLTHAAGEDGAIAVARIGFGLRSRVQTNVPRVIYTEPELAQLGPTEADARGRHAEVRVIRQELGDNDRALTAHSAGGFGKLILVRGRLVGITLVGEHAGELMLPWVMLMGRRTSLWGLSGAVVPYPTRSEISKALAFAAYEDRLFGRHARWWAGLLAWLRRGLAAHSESTAR